MPFLDKTGLAHLWTHIIARLNGKVERSELDELAESISEELDGKAGVSHGHDTTDISGILPIDNGGTGNSTGRVTAGAAGTSYIGTGATAEGYFTMPTGTYGHSEGYSTSASGAYGHTEGFYTNAKGNNSHAEGVYTIANDYQHVSGQYNVEYPGPSAPGAQNAMSADAVFLVGYGTSTTRANAFRITSDGKCKGASSFTGSGADFAELFEWYDGNPNNEDRRGLFVTLDGDKIRPANASDDYIGVISGAQAFIGNTASEEWHGKYVTDVFGTRLFHEVDMPEQIDEATGEVLVPAHKATQYVVNPDYDPNEPYVMRENRKEWGIVGLLGQVVVVDDGTCVVGRYAKPSVNGIATASDNGYRVMKRIDANHIKVLVK